MKLTRCENGHFYDGDKYDTCPHCQVLTEGEAENKTVGLGFHLSGGSDTGDDDSVTEALTASDAKELEKGGDFVQGNIPQGSPEPAMHTVNTAAGSAADYVSQSIADRDEDEDSVTQSFFTAGRGAEQTGARPVVGWLVCIQGAVKGQSYPLAAGKNYIGRSHSMDVSISDPSVSRDKHAVVIFEPRKREFIAMAGESRELLYLNDEMVLNAEKMKARDVLMVGDVKLMLVPFCDETFSWDDIQNA